MVADMENGVSVHGSVTTGPMPKFARPPVEEVTIGVHFKELDRLNVVHAGELAMLWAAQYPRVEQYVPLPPLADELDSPQGPHLPMIRFSPLGRVPLPRVWYLSEDQTFVRQVQSDRVVQNWRRQGTTADYPHYDQLRPKFVQAFQDVMAVARKAFGEQPELTQCEVSYTNPLHLGGPFSRIGDAAQALAPWSGRFSDGFLPEPEFVNVGAGFPISGPDGQIAGRLRVTAEPAIHAPTGSQVILLQLAARGHPIGEGLEGALRFLDLGHEWIVRGFRSFTTPQLHKEWEISE